MKRFVCEWHAGEKTKWCIRRGEQGVHFLSVLGMRISWFG